MITIKKIPFADIESAGVSLHDKMATWTLSDHAKSMHWDIAVNGALFSNGNPKTDPYYYWNTTDLIVGGVFNRGGNYSDKGIAFGNPWEGVSAYWSTTANSKGKPVDFIGGAPTLLVEGKISMDLKGLSAAFANARTQRTAIGIDKANIYIATTKADRHTLNEVALALQKQGCLWAINLDGGGSTAYYEKNGENFTQGRRIPSAFGVKLKKKKPRILLDPGHCPETPGKASPDNSYKEYEFNLDLANRMQKILNLYPVEAIIVDYSHKDPKVELPNLIKQINAVGGDALISLHSNAFGSGWNEANGWEIYTYKNTGESRQIAERIRAESKVLGFTDRGIKDGSGFAVIRDTEMPAVLIETGFHTNKSDLSKLKDPAFREKAAIAYTNGILRHFGIEPKPVVSPPVNAPKVLYRVQVGAFASKSNAEAMMTKLKAAGFEAYIKEDTPQ